MNRHLLATVVCSFAAGLVLAAQAPQPARGAQAQPQPATSATYRSVAEVEKALAARAQATPPPEMMAAGVGRGDAYMINVVRRTKGQGAIAHAAGSEIHSVIDGSATLVTGGTIVRPAAGTQGIATIQGGERHRVQKGDMVLVPPGTPHWYTDIDRVVTYLEIRFDVGAPSGAPATWLSGTDASKALLERGSATNAPLMFSTPLARGDKYQANVVRRTKAQGGGAHEAGTELHHILDGSGTFVTGGKVVRQGDLSVIEGGETRHVSKGDIVLIPAGMPHWYKDVEGTITYLEVRFEVGPSTP